MFKFVEEEPLNKEEKEEIISENMQEYIWKKKEMKKLYLHIPKRSGYGYKINYTPGQTKAKRTLKDSPKQAKGPSFEDMFNWILAAEGLRPMPEKKPEWPLQKVEDLSPRPSTNNSLFKNNKFLSSQSAARCVSKYYQIESIKLRNVFIPKVVPEDVFEEEEEYENEEDRPGYESEPDEEESDTEKKKTLQKRKKETKVISLVYQMKDGEREKMDPMPAWFTIEKNSLWKHDG